MQALEPPLSRVADFPPMVKATIGWLNQRFREWYSAHPPTMPDRGHRREFGYVPWPNYPGQEAFVRHLAFESQDKLRATLVRSGPHSVYYSTAYYMRPGAYTMADKTWWRSELVFDLDADHLPEVRASKAEGRDVPIEQQLALIKGHFKRLVDEFLLGDFGFAEEDVWISFSGGRGYHAHVTDERAMQMSAHERREIVDYITGKFPVLRDSTEPDMAPFLWNSVVHIEKGHSFLKTHIPRATSVGWPGRLTRTLVNLLRQNILETDRLTASAWVQNVAELGPDEAGRFVITFNESMLQRIADGNIEQGKLVKHVMGRILARAVVPAARAEVDEPVSTDVKRVIRLPGSLHGKTGLLCKRIGLDELDAFDPLRDAVAFDNEPITILPRQDYSIRLGGEQVSVHKGQQVEVPRSHAIFICGQQKGTVVA